MELMNTIDETVEKKKKRYSTALGARRCSRNSCFMHLLNGQYKHETGSDGTLTCWHKFVHVIVEDEDNSKMLKNP